MTASVAFRPMVDSSAEVRSGRRAGTQWESRSRERGSFSRLMDVSSVSKSAVPAGPVAPAASAFSLPDVRAVRREADVGAREARLNTMRESANAVEPFEDSRLREASVKARETGEGKPGGDAGQASAAQPRNGGEGGFSSGKLAPGTVGGASAGGRGEIGHPFPNGRGLDGSGSNGSGSDGTAVRVRMTEANVDRGGGQHADRALPAANVMPSNGQATDDLARPANNGSGRGVAEAAAVRSGPPATARSGAPIQNDPGVPVRGKEGSDAAERSRANGPAAGKRATQAGESRQQEQIARIARIIHAKANGKETVARIQLDPPSLGHVRVHLRLTNDELRLRLAAESDTGREVLRGQIHELRAALEQHGLRVRQIELPVPMQGDAGQRDVGQRDAGQGDVTQRGTYAGTDGHGGQELGGDAGRAQPDMTERTAAGEVSETSRTADGGTARADVSESGDVHVGGARGRLDVRV